MGETIKMEWRERRKVKKVAKKEAEELIAKEQEKIETTMSEKCNFYSVRDTYPKSNPKRNMCILGTSFAYEKYCSGDKCIFMKILRNLEKTEDVQQERTGKIPSNETPIQ